VILSRHNSLSQEQMAEVQTIIKMHKKLLSDSDLLDVDQKEQVESLVQVDNAEDIFARPYAAQSGEIFGILKQMKETFESNLSDAGKAEIAAQKSFQAMKEAKTAEINAGKKQIENKSQELADTDEAHAQAKEDLTDTNNSLSADQKFLIELKKKCANTDKEWDSRRKTRTDEIAAVGEAISILTDDNAHDLFSKTLNFLQLSATTRRVKGADNRRKAAAALLEKQAEATKSPQLAMIASAVQLDAFTKVKKAIDDMVSSLKVEQQDEVKHRDFCITEFDENDKSTVTGERNQEDMEGRK